MGCCSNETRCSLKGMSEHEIPEEAAEAAAEWLPHSGDCEVRPERDCTCWQPRVNLMRAALEAAAPHMLAECWDAAIEAHKAWTWDDENVDPLANPYRSRKECA